MASATYQTLRSYGTSHLHKLSDTKASPFIHHGPQVARPHVTEHVQVDPTTGSHAPAGRPVTEVPLSFPVLKSMHIRLRLGKLALGSCSFARYPDLVGLAIWESITVRFGTERLQTIRPEEIFNKIFTQMEDEDRANALQLLAGGLTPAERSRRAQLGAQEIIIPLYTLLGIHLGGDPAQVLAVRCLGEKLRVEIIYRNYDRWVEADGTSFLVGPNGTSNSTVAGYVEEGGLFLEGVHVEESELLSMEALYRGAFQQYFSEQQYVSQYTLSSSTQLNGTSTATIRLDEITQPVTSLYIMCRWAKDLDRTTAVTDGTYGYCPFNVGGWYSPGGVNLPVFEYVEIKTGSNNNVVKRVRVEQLMWLEHARAFRGSPNVAVMKVSFSHDASRENSVLGYMDFSGLDKPVLILTTRNVATTGTYDGSPTIGKASVIDIGVSGDMYIDVIAHTVNQINFASGQMKHLIN